MRLFERVTPRALPELRDWLRQGRDRAQAALAAAVELGSPDMWPLAGQAAELEGVLLDVRAELMVRGLL